MCAYLRTANIAHFHPHLLSTWIYPICFVLYQDWHDENKHQKTMAQFIWLQLFFLLYPIPSSSHLSDLFPSQLNTHCHAQLLEINRLLLLLQLSLLPLEVFIQYILNKPYYNIEFIDSLPPDVKTYVCRPYTTPWAVPDASPVLTPEKPIIVR